MTPISPSLHLTCRLVCPQDILIRPVHAALCVWVNTFKQRKYSWYSWFAGTAGQSIRLMLSLIANFLPGLSSIWRRSSIVPSSNLFFLGKEIIVRVTMRVDDNNRFIMFTAHQLQRRTRFWRVISSSWLHDWSRASNGTGLPSPAPQSPVHF